MGTFRHLCSTLLLVTATHSSALALADEQKTQLKQTRQTMGLADGEMSELLARHLNRYIDSIDVTIALAITPAGAAYFSAHDRALNFRSKVARKKEADRVPSPSHWRASPPEAEKQNDNSMMRDNEYYGPTMLNSMNGIRSSPETSRFEHRVTSNTPSAHPYPVPAKPMSNTASIAG